MEKKSNQDKEKYGVKGFFKDLFNVRSWPANILSLSRVAAPFVIPPIAASGNLPLTLAAGAGFLLTDFADGIVARALKGQTKLGARLDQITDKICAGGLLICLIPSFPLMTVPLVLEGIVAGVNAKALKYGGTGESTFSGKAKMWFLSGTVLAGYCSMAGASGVLGAAAEVFTYGGLFATTLLEILNIDEYNTLAEEAKYQYLTNPDHKNQTADKKHTKENAIIKSKAIEKEGTSILDITDEISRCDDIDKLKRLREITCPKQTISSLDHGQKKIIKPKQK